VYVEPVVVPPLGSPLSDEFLALVGAPMSAAARVAQAQSPDKAAEKSKVVEKVVEKVKD
jgi:hypothetical protein